MEVLELDDISWEEFMEGIKKPVVVMFYSPACPHCVAIEPHFASMSHDFKGRVSFAKLNVLENSISSGRYGIMSTPTFKFFCHGRPVYELVGAPYTALIKKTIEDVLVYGEECIGKSTRFDPAYV